MQHDSSANVLCAYVTEPDDAIIRHRLVGPLLALHHRHYKAIVYCRRADCSRCAARAHRAWYACASASMHVPAGVRLVNFENNTLEFSFKMDVF